MTSLLSVVGYSERAHLPVHNQRGKPLAGPLAAQLRLVDTDVWLDDWKFRPGDSLAGTVDWSAEEHDSIDTNGPAVENSCHVRPEGELV